MLHFQQNISFAILKTSAFSFIKETTILNVTLNSFQRSPYLDRISNSQTIPFIVLNQFALQTIDNICTQALILN
jgi:hypothetical protein